MAFNSQRGGRVAIDDISFSPEFCSTDTGELQPQSLTVNFKQAHLNVVIFMIYCFMGDHRKYHILGFQKK